MDVYIELIKKFELDNPHILQARSIIISNIGICSKCQNCSTSWPMVYCINCIIKYNIPESLHFGSKP